MRLWENYVIKQWTPGGWAYLYGPMLGGKVEWTADIERAQKFEQADRAKALIETNSDFYEGHYQIEAVYVYE